MISIYFYLALSVSKHFHRRAGCHLCLIWNCWIYWIYHLKTLQHEAPVTPFLPEMLVGPLMQPLGYVPVLPNKREKTKLSRHLASGLTCCSHMIFTFSAEWIKWSTSNINNRSNSIYTLKSWVKPTLLWLQALMRDRKTCKQTRRDSTVLFIFSPLLPLLLFPDLDNLYSDSGTSPLL